MKHSDSLQNKLLNNKPVFQTDLIVIQKPHHYLTELMNVASHVTAKA